MATSKILAPLCLMVLVFGLCLSTVKSQSYDVCAGVERPDPETIPCTINCILPDPVCGTDGVTYTCGCLDAFCHGVDVVKKGDPMATSKILAPLCLMVLVFGLCLSTVKSQSYGVCEGFDPEAPRCAVRCSVPDYVCGTDGVTYTCGCKDAFCNGVDVVKKGKC
ncbi:hypothetical protein SADUNF_Sadunf14G0079300 [Salix dunnii]|uniref:Uncharacterized protein n=1 Tax=Salix dunnii TaxID=1413687 RepID=A0A835JGB6_9ROSI|nr:hypothetical protein SADUNF_Sadunf14G0079300 [Salix dunnii]